ncbi:hypothetical protein GRI44_07040 [Altererythrobacter confluentis]|uniref:Uncharacterized protein n=1 Tax=Allopontixanthobacter confluentis TaxID=1849021 RepID=A0A6L7GEP9_9SPHN|nr:hypothetical protein [Allopontixanthobacter confluentis]MXP14503.1 hypothetical protein [Allopontixanthobacter confluentis]
MTKTSIDTDRQNFHRRQVQCPDVLICELDPDPPIILPKHLGIFDGVILSALRTRGWPNTSKKSGPPRRAKGSSLAAKMAKRNLLSTQDIEQLAARINWLQNNAFRWNARDGYAGYFASRDNAGLSVTSSTTTTVPCANKSEEQASTPNLPRTITNDDSYPHQPRVEPEYKPGPKEVSDATVFGSNSVGNDQNLPAHSSDTKQSSGTNFITEDAPPYLNAPQPNPVRPQHLEFESNIDRSLSNGRPQNFTPELPDRPKTYGTDFPIAKAKNFLMANAKQLPIKTQLELGRILIEDPQQLASALKHSERARVDLLNAFGKLGLNSDV